MHALRAALLVAAFVRCGADRGGKTLKYSRVPYSKHRGYIPLGGDLLNGTMTVEKAKVLCNNLPECVGMTFAAEWDTVWAVGLDRFRVQVWLKGFDEWIEGPGHVTLLKVLSNCSGMSYKKYGHRAAHRAAAVALPPTFYTRCCTSLPMTRALRLGKRVAEAP